MARHLLSASLGAALVFSSLTGSFAAVDAGAQNALLSSISSLPASAARDNLIAQIQSLSAACGGGSSGACVVALQNVVAAAQTLGVTGTVASEVASLTRETAANTPGVTSEPSYASVAQATDSLSPSSSTQTGAVSNTGNTTGGTTDGGSPGGGGGDTGSNGGVDSAASPGA